MLVVGSAPTKGEHFAGAEGTYLRRVIKRLGVDPDEVAYTTALSCSTPKHRQPTTKEVGYCRPNVTRILNDYVVIIPMGHAAVSAVLRPLWLQEVGSLERWVGWQIPAQGLNAWVCPTWSPAQLLSSDDDVLKRQFTDHLKAALAKSDRPWPDGPPDWGRDVKHITDTEDAAAWLRACARQSRGAIAWDYETNALKPDGADGRIVSCSVAWGRMGPERCVAFPWHGAAVPAMGELLRSPIPKIASNLKFEDRWTRKAFGHRVRGWAWDTMLAAHVCDNRPGITSVKFQAFVRCGAPVWNDKIEPFLKTKAGEQINSIISQISLKDLLRYNGLDAILEYRVAVAQMEELGYDLPWRV